MEQKSEDKITPDNSHLHLRSKMFPLCWVRAYFTVLFISKLACTVEVWILFRPSFNCFHWFSKNCYFTAYHENLVYVAWKHLVSELPVSLQVHVANNYVFPIGALPPGRAEARETLGRSGHNLGVSFGPFSCIKDLVNEDTLLRTHCCPWCFLSCANLETFVTDTKCFSTKSNIFCVPDTKFVSATNVARAGKRGNLCVGNNVSATKFVCQGLNIAPGLSENAFIRACCNII